MGVERSPPPTRRLDENGAAGATGGVQPATETTEQPEFNCPICERADTQEMVQCDTCDEWHHFDCVGVDHTVAERSWLCPRCSPRARRRQSSQDRLSSVSNASRMSRTDISMRRLEILRQKDAIANQQLEILNTLEAEGENVANAAQEQTTANRTGAIPKRPGQSTASAPQSNTNDRAGSNNAFRSNAARFIAANHPRGQAAPPPSRQAQPQNSRRPGASRPHMYDFPPPPSASSPVQPPRPNASAQQQQAPNASAQHQQAPNASAHQRQAPNVSAQPQRAPNVNVHPPADELTQQMQRLLIRQSMPKELPTFSGRAEEWSTFISSYEQTTSLCGYTNAENSIRLRHALRGKAREVVESQLALPECVPNIIETLANVFGRPERLINSQIERIRKATPLRQDKLESFVDLSLLISNLVATLNASGLHNYKDDPVLIQEIVNKLPNRYKLDWAAYKRENYIEIAREGELTTLAGVLHTVAMDACSVMDRAPHTSDQNERSRKDRPHVNIHHEESSEGEYIDEDEGPELNAHQEVSTKPPPCIFCREDCIKLESCKKFEKVPLNEKWEFVRNQKLCRICLCKHPRGCKDAKRCGADGCDRYHHPILHYTNEKAKIELHTCQYNSSNVLFRVIPVRIQGERNVITTFAFMDEGSSVSLMDHDLANDLGLQGIHSPLHLKWTGDKSRMEEDSQKISIKIINPNDERKSFPVDVRTVKALSLPKQTLNYTHLKENSPHLQNLPIESYEDAVPKLLLGMNAQRLIVPNDVRESESHQLIATRCKLGWTISGHQSQIKELNTSAVHTVNAHICDCTKHADEKLDETFKDYLKLDSLGIVKNPNDLFTSDEKEAMKMMESMTTKKGDKYETGLLWKYQDALIPDSFPMALSRWKCQKARMERDEKLKETCNDQIQKYLKKGYIRKLTPAELNEPRNRKWYLPVFSVTNKNKPGKIRLVWDAAATVNGVSLNSLLHTGPDINATLFEVLLRFRERRVAVNGDIEEMFHRVSINADDQHCQRFLWYDIDDPSQNYAIYVMQVVTFGATCSPYQAQHVKNENAQRYATNSPLAVKIIQIYHYVDDMLASFDSEEEAIATVRQVKEIHRQGNFNIRNWRSNSTAVLEAMGESTEPQSVDMLSSRTGQAEKVLGMWWQTIDDTMTYSLRFVSIYDEVVQTTRPPTKRQLLRLLMSIYDPLGLIAQFLVGLKMILQEVQKTQIGWDEPIEEAQEKKWKAWIQHLPKIENLRIPRCYLSPSLSWEGATVSIQTFVDASENAMAATVYLRIQKGDAIHVSLVAAKSKNAPTKKTSIPRLELQAAVIGARLAQSIKRTLTIPIDSMSYWSDNRAVLSWIRSRNVKLTPFVAFRVSEIHELTNVQQWRWVPTEDNVADEGTKYSDPPELQSNARWYTGPAFLCLDESNWPVQPTVTNEELVMIHTTQEPLLDFGRYSSWLRLLRTTAYLYRFISQASLQTHCQHKLLLDANELARARNFLIRQAQIDAYPHDYRALKIGNDLDIECTLFRMSPMIDENGIIRIRGRIDRCKDATNDCKQPIILPRQHKVTELIIKEEHEKLDHHYDSTVVNNLRQTYFIPEIRVAVKMVRKRCQVCSNNSAKPAPPEEAELPHDRLCNNTRPFTHVGIDYFGPINTSCRRQTVKTWGVIFTCLTTRAIHLEMVESLTSDSCIAAIKCFENRRGTPRSYRSDRGTNFIAAEKELKEELKNIDPELIAKGFVSPETEWYFNPPAAAHMGGPWERMVRAVKVSLKPRLAKRNPTRQELHGYFTEIENIINSRPLTYVPIDDAESEALTPNHFLLGTSNGTKPIGPLDDSAPLLRKSWMNIQLMAQQFWKRWVREYLPDLVRRTKWYDPNVRNLEVGDIVLIVDENFPRNNWPKGRIIKVMPSPDEKVRKAVVQTAQGIYTRPATKLARLEVQSEVEAKVHQRGGMLPATSKTDPRNETSKLSQGNVKP